MEIYQIKMPAISFEQLYAAILGSALRIRNLKTHIRCAPKRARGLQYVKLLFQNEQESNYKRLRTHRRSSDS